MEDFEYKGHICLFLPHPKLYGNYEIYQIEGEKEHILSRAKDKSDCIRIIDKSGRFYTMTDKKQK